MKNPIGLEVILAIAGLFLFLVPVIQVFVGGFVPNCGGGSDCEYVKVRGYGSITYWLLGVGGLLIGNSYTLAAR